MLIFMPLNRLFADTSSHGTEDFVRGVVSKRFPRLRRDQTEPIDRAILDLSHKNGLDPLLVLAVIERESGFQVKKRGTHGEIGLMQIKPRTARWLAHLKRLRWDGERTLEDPVKNIEVGFAYLAHLRETFPSERLF